MKAKQTIVILILGWITVLFNYVYGDIFVLMNPAEMNLILEGKIGGEIEINNVFLLQAALLMESAIGMIGATYVLNRKWARITNLIMICFHLFVVIASQFIGTPPSWSYIFFSAVECLVLGGMLVAALRWQADTNSLAS